MYWYWYDQGDKDLIDDGLVVGVVRRRFSSPEAPEPNAPFYLGAVTARRYIPDMTMNKRPWSLVSIGEPEELSSIMRTVERYASTTTFAY